MITFSRAQAIAAILGYEATLLFPQNGDDGIYTLTSPAGHYAARQEIVERGSVV